MKSRRESAKRRICATERKQGMVRPPPDRRAAPRPSRCILRGIPSPASRRTARSAANGTGSPRSHASDSHGSLVATRAADRAPAQTQAHEIAKPTTARHPLIQGLQKATPRAPTARPAAAEASRRARRSPACRRTRRTARHHEAPSDYPFFGHSQRYTTPRSTREARRSLANTHEARCEAAGSDTPPPRHCLDGLDGLEGSTRSACGEGLRRGAPRWSARRFRGAARATRWRRHRNRAGIAGNRSRGAARRSPRRNTRDEAARRSSLWRRLPLHAPTHSETHAMNRREAHREPHSHAERSLPTSQNPITSTKITTHSTAFSTRLIAVACFAIVSKNCRKRLANGLSEQHGRICFTRSRMWEHTAKECCFSAGVWSV